jgi:hypothetical protein
MSAKRENGLAKATSEKLRSRSRVAGKTPALPAESSSKRPNTPATGNEKAPDEINQ